MPYVKKPYVAKSKPLKKDDKQDKEINRLKRVVSSLSKMETKYAHTTVSESTLVVGTPKSFLLNGIATGTSSTARIGNSIKWVNLNARIYFHSLSGLTVDTPIRMLVVRTKASKGDTFTWADLFLNTSTPSERTQFNYENRPINNMFDIVYDKSFLLAKHAVDATSTNMHTFGSIPSTYLFNFNRKLNFVTKYNTTTATVDAIETNTLHLLIFSDNSTANVIVYTANIYLTGEDV